MKQILLTQGQYAIVDDADYDRLNRWKWHARKEGLNFYAARNPPKNNQNKAKIYMARQILGLEYGDPREADHIKHNTLDNRRSELRICTHQQNMRNRRSFLNKTSRFKGINWCKRLKNWQVAIRANGKIIYLGRFKDEKEAALVYNTAAKKYYGKFAYLNKTA